MTTSASIQYINSNDFTSQKISIMEKIDRIPELQDPDLIDVEYIQHLANNYGYDIGINRSELGTMSVISDISRDPVTETNKYLRFITRELPTWYKIKSTRNAVRIMLYSFGIIGDISYYYTDDYSVNGKWMVPDYDMENTSIENIPDNFFPTPHFVVWADLDKGDMQLSYEYDKRKQIINAIQAIRPINTVFRHLGGYLLRNLDMYVGMQARFRRYLKIESNGYSDAWKP